MNEKMKNPWRGLQAYREGEILYGRDEDILRLSGQVLSDTDTVLYGKSGIGKSSLLNAGVIPAARRKGVFPVSIRLEHRAGARSYVGQVQYALEEAGVAVRPAHPTVSREASFWEFVHCNRFYIGEERQKLLVIFDQFEEIFTLQQDIQRKRQFFEEMADLLNDIMPRSIAEISGRKEKETEAAEISDAGDLDLDDLDFSLEPDTHKYIDDNEVHFVFTLREDFLSDFEYYTAAIPSLKQHRYGLRPINEEQAAEIIQKPQRGLVSGEVAKLIIEKVTGRSDFEIDGKPEIEVDSAVLSLYLSRLYEEKDGETITAGLVENKGGAIIQDFYDSCIRDIPPQVVEYLEDELLNADGRRENKSLSIVCRKVGKEPVGRLINCQLLRRFAYAGDIRVEFIHDILCPVIRERKEQREAARLQEEERRKQEAEKQRILAEVARIRRRNRQRLLAVASVLTAILMGCALYYMMYIHVYESYYAAFERRNGWPVGIGRELSSSERQRTPLYYKLSHKGSLPYDTDVEVMSSNPRLPLSPRVPSLEADGEERGDMRAAAYYDMLSRIRTLHFVEGENGKVDKEIATDENGSALFVINYFHLPGRPEAWQLFNTPTGQSLKIRDNEADRVKLSWDREGRIESLMYFDARGVRQPVAKGAYGYLFRYAGDGEKTFRYVLDGYGRAKQGEWNVQISRTAGNDTMETAYAKARSVDDTLPAPAVGPRGYSRSVRTGNRVQLYDVRGQQIATCSLKYDNRGNIVEERTEGNVSIPYPALVRYTYDHQTGYLIAEEKLDRDGRPFSADTTGIYKKQWRYTPEGQLVSEEFLAPGGESLFAHRISRSGDVTSDLVDDKIRRLYILRVDSLRADGRTTSYYGPGRIPLNHRQTAEQDTLEYCRVAIRRTESGETRTYYSYDPASRQTLPFATMSTSYGGRRSVSRLEEGTKGEGSRYYRLYDPSGKIIRSMIYFYQNGQPIARAVMGVDGTPVRCHKWEKEGYAYYKLYYNEDFEGNYISVAAVNEWEQPSIFFDPLGSVYMSISYKNYQGGSVRHESMETIIRDPYWQFTLDRAKGISRLQVPYLHILDKSSPLYGKSGLRDGDRIVALGSWRLGGSEEAFAAQWKKLPQTPLPISVLRPTVDSFVRIEKTVSTSNAPLEEYHFYALTKDEQAFLENYLNAPDK